MNDEYIMNDDMMDTDVMLEVIQRLMMTGLDRGHAIALVARLLEQLELVHDLPYDEHGDPKLWLAKQQSRNN